MRVLEWKYKMCHTLYLEMIPLGEAGSVHCTVILVLPGLPAIIRLRGTLDAVRKEKQIILTHSHNDTHSLTIIECS